MGMWSLHPQSSKSSSTRLATSENDRHNSSNENKVMESVDDKKPWTVDRERRPSGLRVVLPKRT
jgi:hypothetical protein